MTTYTAYTTPGEGWLTAIVPEVPGLVTEGRTPAEVIDMVRDALTLFPEVESDPDNANVIIESVNATKFDELIAA